MNFQTNGEQKVPLTGC